MRSQSKLKSRLSQFALPRRRNLIPLEVAEQDRDGRFKPEVELTLFLHTSILRINTVR